MWHSSKAQTDFLQTEASPQNAPSNVVLKSDPQNVTQNRWLKENIGSGSRLPWVTFGEKIPGIVDASVWS